MCLGPGLVFVVYPAAIARMPGSPVWAALFFVFLFTVGVDSQVSTVSLNSSSANDTPTVLVIIGMTLLALMTGALHLTL